MKPIISIGLLALSILRASAASAADAPSAATTATLTAARKFATITLGNPRGLAVDKAGNIYVGDVDQGKISKITPDGKVSEINGSHSINAIGLGIGRDGSVFAADADGNAIYKMAVDGAVTTLTIQTGDADLTTPTGVAIDAAGNAFVSNNGAASILKITPSGVGSVFAGKVGNSGAADGAGPAASFVTPRGIAIDAKDNLYVADEGNSNIRKITPSGAVSTLAGMAGTPGGEDGAGTAAHFSAPRSIAATADGTVYVADTDNHCIRKITPAGVVTTLAGKAGEAGRDDGPAKSARFSEPRGITVDAAGNVFVADTGNGAIRQIAPSGVVTTIAGAEAPVPAAAK